MVVVSFTEAVAGFGPVYSGNWCEISVAIKVLEEAGGQGDQVALTLTLIAAKGIR